MPGVRCLSPSEVICSVQMKFQTFSLHDITEKEIGRTYSTGLGISNHWNRIMTKPHCVASREVENIFEEVRLAEFPESPSRKHCLFLFDLSLDPYSYAESMNFIPAERHLAELEIIDSHPKIARVNKSLLECRIKDGKLNADREDIVGDARAYWSGVTQTSLDEEILFSGRYRYTRIIRPQDSLFRPLLRKLNEEQTDAI